MSDRLKLLPVARRSPTVPAARSRWILALAAALGAAAATFGQPRTNPAPAPASAAGLAPGDAGVPATRPAAADTAGSPAAAGPATLPAAAPPTVTAGGRLADVVVHGRSEDLVGVAETGSQGYVGAEQLARRPLLRPGEVLEAVPGVVVTQHSGAGKANQFFVRGFNLDHGTDFATTVAGLPAAPAVGGATAAGPPPVAADEVPETPVLEAPVPDPPSPAELVVPPPAESAGEPIAAAWLPPSAVAPPASASDAMPAFPRMPRPASWAAAATAPAAEATPRAGTSGPPAHDLPAHGPSAAADGAKGAATPGGGQSAAAAVSPRAVGKAGAGRRSGYDDRGVPIPEYPPESRRRREQGLVEIDVEVLADGRVGQVKVVSDGGHPRLAAAAVSAVVERGAFEPGTLGGRPATGHLIVPFQFVLSR